MNLPVLVVEQDYTTTTGNLNGSRRLQKEI